MHPVVLAHGFFGFAKMAGIEYFRGVQKHLKKKFPDLRIFVTEVAPNDLCADRARQLGEQIGKIDDRVHIIGHSMGGMDARFLLSPQGLDRSSRVVSLTTLSTAHWGSPVADFIINIKGFPHDTDILSRLPKGVQRVIRMLKKKGKAWRYLLELLNFSGGAMTNLTTGYMREFNQKYLDAPHVKYFSYAGVSGPSEKDRLPALMIPTWAIIFANLDSRFGGRNDGIVSVESAKWGEFKGEIPLDHFKEVGHDLAAFACLRKLCFWKKRFSHLDLFEGIVKDLQALERSTKENGRAT